MYCARKMNLDGIACWLLKKDARAAAKLIGWPPRFVSDVQGRMGMIYSVICDSTGKPLTKEHYAALKEGKARMDQLGYLVVA